MGKRAWNEKGERIEDGTGGIGPREADRGCREWKGAAKGGFQAVIEEAQVQEGGVGN